MALSKKVKLRIRRNKLWRRYRIKVYSDHCLMDTSTRVDLPLDLPKFFIFSSKGPTHGPV